MAERTAVGGDPRGAAPGDIGDAADPTPHGPEQASVGRTKGEGRSADTSIAGVLVSPTEPPPIRALGTTSSLPERYGSDVLFDASPLGRVGVQRKTVRDLFASVTDGRLTRSVAAMSALDVAVLIVEGDLRWSGEGVAEPAEGSARPVTSWRREAYRSLLWSIRARGVWVETVPDIEETVTTVRSLHRWASKASHDALDRRPGPRGVDAASLHILQGLAGIGPRLATRILEHFQGLPIAWTVTERELTAVRGLGPVRARRLSESLAGQHRPPAGDDGLTLPSPEESAT